MTWLSLHELYHLHKVHILQDNFSGIRKETIDRNGIQCSKWLALQQNGTTQGIFIIDTSWSHLCLSLHGKYRTADQSRWPAGLLVAETVPSHQRSDVHWKVFSIPVTFSSPWLWSAREKVKQIETTWTKLFNMSTCISEGDGKWTFSTFPMIKNWFLSYTISSSSDHGVELSCNLNSDFTSLEMFHPSRYFHGKDFLPPIYNSRCINPQSVEENITYITYIICIYLILFVTFMAWFMKSPRLLLVAHWGRAEERLLQPAGPQPWGNSKFTRGPANECFRNSTGFDFSWNFTGLGRFRNFTLWVIWVLDDVGPWIVTIKFWSGEFIRQFWYLHFGHWLLQLSNVLSGIAKEPFLPTLLGFVFRGHCSEARWLPRPNHQPTLAAWLWCHWMQHDMLLECQRMT